MTPTIGRIVHFEVDEDTAKAINKRAKLEGGNCVVAGDLIPAMIVRVWNPDCVNLHVFCDGPCDAWITSVTRGRGPRTFRAPEIVIGVS